MIRFNVHKPVEMGNAEAVRNFRDAWEHITGEKISLMESIKCVKDGVGLLLHDEDFQKISNLINNKYNMETHVLESGKKVIDIEKYLSILFNKFEETHDPQYIFAACEFKKAFGE